MEWGSCVGGVEKGLGRNDGILGNKAADVLAKRAAERVPVDDYEKWRGYKEGNGWWQKAVTNYKEERPLGAGGMTR